MPKFEIGSQVRLKSRRDRAGVITQPPPRMTAGEYWYTVFFESGGSARHPENDLESYDGSLDDVPGQLVGDEDHFIQRARPGFERGVAANR